MISPFPFMSISSFCAKVGAGPGNSVISGGDWQEGRRKVLIGHLQRDVVLLSQIIVDGSKGMAGEVIPVSEGDTTLIVEDCAVVRDLASNISLQQSMDTLRVSRFSSTHGRFYRILGWDMGHIWAVSWDEMPQLRLSEG